MRVELRDGQWAELRERINHGTDKELKKLVLRTTGDESVGLDLDTAVVRAFVTAWHVLDPDGSVIPLGDADAIERAPDDIGGPTEAPLPESVADDGHLIAILCVLPR